eukprot:TRINITY_DN14979_c0_g1_i1.p1 TRINITY_DN14979_c0_g1~~TRINITY_DN14979_c0_g1_i1.p1  ORF type:complete len:272 (-),score=92.23 TRINITY_DN14979_c0_g1_i1:155-970(-)
MADDDVVAIPVFNPSSKKKRKGKGKKKAFVAPVVADAGGVVIPGAVAAAAEPVAEPVADPVAEATDDATPDAVEAGDSEAADTEAADGVDENADDNVVIVNEEEKDSWLGSDRDYTFPELLGRVFKIMNDENPDLAGQKRHRYVMRPPEVMREGSKKTVWANFDEVCTTLKRNRPHLQAYTLAELGTSGTLDASYRLTIKGRFQPKQIERIIRNYIGEYVACRTCKSPDTQLVKENRLYFVQCKACGSKRSVAAIKTGYVAQVGKRKRKVG